MASGTHNNIDGQSLRGFLHMVEANYPDEFLRISEPIDRRFDMTAIVFELQRAGKNPVVVLEHVDGYDKPVVTNVAANRRLLAACLGVDTRDLPAAFRERCQRYIPCATVTEAAWNDVVIEGEDVDLTKLPITLQFAVDGAPYITAGQISARDPRTGIDTTGFHRLSPADAEGEEPPRSLAAFTAPALRIPPPRRRTRQVAASGGDHRDASAALYGLDGLRLSAEHAEIRDHRRPVRRALPGGALRHR
jgi:hypothetical protein